jgi:hypothetical protein
MAKEIIPKAGLKEATTTITPANYPSNSNKNKTGAVQRKPVRVLKKPKGRQMVESFLGDDVKSIGSYIMEDIVSPMIKNTIFEMFQGGMDIIRGGLERVLLNEDYNYKKYKSKNGNVDYKGISNSKNTRRQKPVNKHDFRTILFDTRGEAEDCLDKLTDLCIDYGQATLGDFYEFTKIPSNFTDAKYGWVDMRSVKIRRKANGYCLDLPRPILLD